MHFKVERGMRRQKARIAQPLENTYLYGMQERLLDVQGLKTHLFASGGVAKAVDGVDLSLSPGEFVGVVGESGCGKTMLALSLLRLVPDPPGRVVDGSVLFKGRDLLRLSEAEMRRVRGNQISMVFQEPMTSLNPVLTVGEQIAESIRLHQESPGKKPWRPPRRCSPWLAFPTLPAGWEAILMNCPGACGSGWSSPWLWPAIRI